nr:MAG TPA: hypothetical protein [Caudoviricetes sp.]
MALKATLKADILLSHLTTIFDLYSIHFYSEIKKYQ